MVKPLIPYGTAPDLPRVRPADGQQHRQPLPLLPQRVHLRLALLHVIRTARGSVGRRVGGDARGCVVGARGWSFVYGVCSSL